MLSLSYEKIFLVYITLARIKLIVKVTKATKQKPGWLTKANANNKAKKNLSF